MTDPLCECYINMARYLIYIRYTQRFGGNYYSRLQKTGRHCPARISCFYFKTFGDGLNRLASSYHPNIRFSLGGEGPSFILIYKQQTQHGYQRQFTV